MMSFSAVLAHHIVGRSVEHLKKELQQKGDIGLVAEVWSTAVAFKVTFHES